ncbi:unnamed protein product [Lactuca virosa]|uniref:Uncharacterized protein n=1 Tax=Lactuca virosa TaxID=75947 RepID=A0AAU9P7J1_9ASTR|nr:unnamed protein product [Lactuca virosa]
MSMFCCIFMIHAFKSSIGLSMSMFCCIFRIRAFKSSIEWTFPSDHVVEKERDFKLMIEVNNLINSDSSIFLPVSIFSDERGSPGDIGVHPCIRLTPEILTLEIFAQITKTKA